MSGRNNIDREFWNAMQKKEAQKSAPCFYRGCTKKAVNSHSISKKSALSVIAEGNKIITPEFKRSDETLWRIFTLKPRGTNEASTFKGFCEDHEKLFFELDIYGIETLRSLFLQIYRSLSYFISSTDRLDGVMAEFFPWSSLEKSWKGDMSVSAEKMHDMFLDLLIDFPESNTPLPCKPRQTITLKPFSSSQEPSNYQIILRKIPFVIPVAVQDLKAYRSKLRSGYQETLSIVIPSEHDTTIIIVCHEDFIDETARSISGDLECVEFVESLIIRDSIFFIPPSIIEGMSKEKRKTIESDYIFFTELSDKNYDMSIFDKLRCEIAESMPEDKRSRELKKINHIPLRPPLHERARRLQDKAIMDRWIRMGLMPK